MASAAGHGLWVASLIITIYNKPIQEKLSFSHVELEKYSPCVPIKWVRLALTRRPVYPVWT